MYISKEVLKREVELYKSIEKDLFLKNVNHYGKTIAIQLHTLCIKTEGTCQICKLRETIKEKLQELEKDIENASI